MSRLFVIRTTPLRGLLAIDRTPSMDGRGFFERLFCSTELAEAGFSISIAQVNRSFTRNRATVRGMHFQHPPHADIKIVLCLKGSVFDVAVDIRAGSPTFLRWHADELSDDNNRSVLIPAGFAHGFQTLSENCELLYFHSAAYAPKCQGAIHANDPRLRIAWPLPISELSERDSAHPFLAEDFAGITA